MESLAQNTCEYSPLPSVNTPLYFSAVFLILSFYFSFYLYLYLTFESKLWILDTSFLKTSTLIVYNKDIFLHKYNTIIILKQKNKSSIILSNEDDETLKENQQHEKEGAR